MSAPKRFGRFEIRGVLGRGGMGTVYLAIDPVIGREVAIKEIRPDPGASDYDRKELERRFESEFRAAGTLSHPNVVTVFDVGEGGGAYFIAMELVEGKTLAAHLRTVGRASLPEVLELARQIAAGLDYAHGRGIVHRDVKPGNVLLTEDGRVKITDFGLAKVLSVDVTRTGTLLGTPAYMSPEQVRGRPVDRRSDQFSFAVVLYEMLTGVLPFEADHPSGVLYKIANEDPEPPRAHERSLPPAVDDVILRGLAKDPAERHPSCGALVALLQQTLVGARPDLASFAHGAPTVVVPETPAARPDDAAPTVAFAASPASADSAGARPPAARPPAARPPAARPPAARPEGFDHATPPPTSLAERLRVAAAAAPIDQRRRVAVAAVVAAAVLAGLGGFLLARGGGAEADATPAPVAPPVRVAATLAVAPADGLAAAVWLDDADTGLVTPTSVELRGAEGDAVRVELRRDREVVAAETFVLGPGLPASWTPGEAPPPPPEAREIVVTSQPAGAEVTVDGRRRGETPVTLELEADQAYDVRLELPGHEPTGWRFGLGDLTAEQLQSGRLHFPLRSTEPPAALVVTAGYPVTVFVDGARHAASTRHELRLTAGAHTIRLVADEVFLRQTYTVDLASGASETLAAPRAVAVDIAASPGNCEVTIDGIAAGFTPIHDRAIVLGPHELRFVWPSLGRSAERQETITRDGQRIFATAP